MKLKIVLAIFIGVCIIPYTTYSTISSNSRPLADDEIIIRGEIKKISCDVKDFLTGDLFAERVTLFDQLTDFRKRNRERFFNHPLNEERKADYEAAKTERRRLIIKMADYEDIERLESRKAKDIKMDIDILKKTIESASLFEKVFLYLQLADLQKQSQEAWNEVGRAHDAWRETQDDWVLAHNSVAQRENEAETAERDLDTLTIELKIANSHDFDEKITTFCSNKKIGGKLTYKFPDAPDIKKPQRGSPIIRAEIDRLQKAYKRTTKPRARLGNPLIRDAFNPPKYYPGI